MSDNSNDSENIASERQPSDLFQQVQTLHQEYEQNPEQAQKRQQKFLTQKRDLACRDASLAILKNHENQIIQAANMNKQNARVFEWRHGDQIRFNGCYLRDLLNRGDLLERLQTTLDEMHGAGHFKIYNTILSQRQSYPANERHYAIYISWNSDEFERLETMIAENRQRFSEPPSQRRPLNRGRGGPGKVNGRGRPTVVPEGPPSTEANPTPAEANQTPVEASA